MLWKFGPFGTVACLFSPEATTAQTEGLLLMVAASLDSPFISEVSSMVITLLLATCFFVPDATLRKCKQLSDYMPRKSNCVLDKSKQSSEVRDCTFFL